MFYLSEYIDFWFDSIHCLSKHGKDVPAAKKLNPPVILVCTGTDKYTTEVNNAQMSYMSYLCVFIMYLSHFHFLLYFLLDIIQWVHIFKISFGFFFKGSNELFLLCSCFLNTMLTMYMYML